MKQPQRRTLFVSVNITTAARDALRAATVELTGAPAGRRLSMSDVLVHALGVAMNHRDELATALRGSGGEQPGRPEDAQSGG